jgi:hypothetical protein
MLVGESQEGYAGERVGGNILTGFIPYFAETGLATSSTWILTR